MENEFYLQTLIAYNHRLPRSVNILPDAQNILVAAGNTLIQIHLPTRKQVFLRGHTNEITCFRASFCGKKAVSAEKGEPGFPALINLWDLQQEKVLQSFKLHKGAVQGLAFSRNGAFLASAGGVEDKNRLVVWDLALGKATYCFSFGLAEIRDFCFFNGREDKLVAVTEHGIHIMTLNSKDKKIEALDCSVGNFKRTYTAVVLDPLDTYLYAATRTGDVFEVQVERGLMKRVAPCGPLFENGVKDLIARQVDGEFEIVIGTGIGLVARIDMSSLKIKAQCNLEGGVTGLCMSSNGKTAFAGTDAGNLYSLDLAILKPMGKTVEIIPYSLKESNHTSRVNSVAFPRGFSEVFATASKNQIRVWALQKKQELLRISVPQAECNCVAFPDDGKAILSGWSDGQVRAFLPQTGKLMWALENAHLGGVTSITISPNSDLLISGGAEGEIRLWRISKTTRTLEASLKEHRAAVWSLQLRSADELLSCSADGSCIVWDVKSRTRVLCIFDKTLFKRAVYCPDGSQILTVGNDCKLAYWSAYDGEAIRSLEGGEEEKELSALDISSAGNFLVTGGLDGILRLWSYFEGSCVWKGVGHVGGIVDAKISPDGTYVVSTGVEGDIGIWKIPDSAKSLK